MAALTPPPALGAACPDFRLPAVDGRTYGRDDFAASPVLVVMFICNHCPYVKAVEDRFISLARLSAQAAPQDHAAARGDRGRLPALHRPRQPRGPAELGAQEEPRRGPRH